MQVTQAQEHVTHALVGSKQTIDMGVAETAAFFTMMSSTLYSNQKLAAVREILTNAWDAHIDSNRTHIPLQITLTEDQLIIRDFGYGIPHDMIGPIYGVYGGSTKTHDEKSTGGFGLGSKAPFAYTEHFRVISRYDGVRTVYQMSKSSNEVEGKPSIDTIISNATEDSGLTVSMDINAGDMLEFNSLVAGVIANGNILADVNGKRAKTLPFDSMKHDFLITSDDPLNDNAVIKIRYGTVVYPLHANNEIESAFDRVLFLMNQLNNKSASWHRDGPDKLYLILQAEPNTLTVTPSRETLSMQTKTVNTLNKLLTDFYELVVKRVDPACKPIINEATKNLFINNPQLATSATVDINKELYSYLQAGDVTTNSNDSAIYTVTTQGTAKLLVARRKLINATQHKKLWLQRLKCRMPRLPFQMLGPAQSLYREVRRSNPIVLNESFRRPTLTSWLRNRIITPLVNGMVTTNLQPKRLFVCNNEFQSYWRNRARSIKAKAERRIDEDISLSYRDCLDYLEPTIVISHNKRDRDNALRDYIHHQNFKKENEELRDILRESKGYLLYIVERKDEAIAEARQFFGSTCIKVIDLTPFQYLSTEERSSPSRTTRPISRKKGYAALSSIKGIDDINLLYSQSNEAKRILEPKCYTHIPIKKPNLRLDKLPGKSSELTNFLIKNYGEVTALAVTENQERKCQVKKIPILQEYVALDLFEQLKKKKSLLTYLANKEYIVRNDSLLSGDNRRAFDVIINDSYLSKHYKVSTNVDEDDKQFLAIWNTFDMYLPQEQTDEYQKLLKPSKAIDKLVSLIENAPLGECLDWFHIRAQLRGSDFDTDELKKLHRVIKTIFKEGN